jgi:hypothetical protein
MVSSRIYAFFTSSLFLMGFNQTVAEATQVETRIVRTSIKEGVIDLSVRLSLPFDWKDERYFSIKEFPVDAPPGFPNPGTTRHQLQWNSDGTFEWFQFDYIQAGTYRLIEEHTIEARLFGGQILLGSFDPISKVLKFDGLEYIADFSIPDVTVEVSGDLSEWTKVEQLEEISQDFTEGHTLSVRFKRRKVGSEYYRVRINGGATLPVNISNDGPETFQLDPFVLEEASLDDCLLTLDVNYGGGCKEHEFEVFMSPSLFDESLPVRANLWLKHNGNGDFCRGLVSDKLVVDITAVIEQYRAQYGRDDEIILNVHGYFSDKPNVVKVVRYSP